MSYAALLREIAGEWVPDAYDHYGAEAERKRLFTLASLLDRITPEMASAAGDLYRYGICPTTESCVGCGECDTIWQLKNDAADVLEAIAGGKN